MNRLLHRRSSLTRRFARREFLAFALLSASVVAAGEPAAEIVASGFHSIYSPYVFGERLYAGGWPTPPERVPWPDRLFQARRQATGWSDLEPVRWTNRDQPAGEIGGHHANDPVVFHDHVGERLVMLYTAFPNDAIDPRACDPDVNPTDCLDVRRHAVAWLTSEDGGKHWTDQGVLLRAPDGVWSPGAVVVGDELWVYYMDATLPVARSGLWRRRVSLSGIVPVGAPERVAHPGDGISNPDVRRSGDTFLLAGNRNAASEIHLYESEDGLVFREPACWRNPVVYQTGVRLDGPHLANVSPLEVLSGYNAGAGSDRIVRFSLGVCGEGPRSVSNEVGRTP